MKRKRVLVVSQIPTHPTIAANQWWIMANCKAIEELGCDVHFLYVYDKPIRGKDDGESIELSRNYWKDRFHLYKISFLEKIVIVLKCHIHRLLHGGYIKCDDLYPLFLHHYVTSLNKSQGYDVCIVQYFYLTKLFEKIDIQKKALVTHDNFAYKDLVVGQKPDYTIDANESAKAMQRSPYIFAFNTNEEIFFSLLSPKSKVYTIYSIFEYHPQPIVGNQDILFLSGSNQWNQNGLNWFLNNIFPAIRKRFPECRLLLGGAICAKYKHLNDDGIVLCGFIDDVYSFYSQADVCINPTYQGTGFKTKTFEAISYDKIELAHPHSAIGIYKPEIAPMFISSDANEWVRTLEEIWSDRKFILEGKKRNKSYMSSFKEYVVNIYREFLNS